MSEAEYFEFEDYPHKKDLFSYDGDYEEPDVERVNEEIFKKFDKKVFNKGDCIRIGPPAERNDNVFVFDGDKFLELDDSIDQYGALPKSITVTELGVPTDYWANVITHDFIIHLDKNLVLNSIDSGRVRKLDILSDYCEYEPKFFTTVVNVNVNGEEIKYFIIYVTEYERGLKNIFREKVQDDNIIYRCRSIDFEIKLPRGFSSKYTVYAENGWWEERR